MGKRKDPKERNARLMAEAAAARRKRLAAQAADFSALPPAARRVLSTLRLLHNELDSIRADKDPEARDAVFAKLAEMLHVTVSGRIPDESQPLPRWGGDADSHSDSVMDLFDHMMYQLGVDREKEEGPFGPPRARAYPEYKGYLITWGHEIVNGGVTPIKHRVAPPETPGEHGGDLHRVKETIFRRDWTTGLAEIVGRRGLTEAEVGYLWECFIDVFYLGRGQDLSL